MTNNVLITDYNELLNHWKISEREFALLHLITRKMRTIAELRELQRPFDYAHERGCLNNAINKLKSLGYIRIIGKNENERIGLKVKGDNLKWSFSFLQAYGEVLLEQDKE